MPTLALIDPSLGRRKDSDLFWLVPSTSFPHHRLMCKESIFLYHKCILKQVKKRKIESSFTLLNGL